MATAVTGAAHQMTEEMRVSRRRRRYLVLALATIAAGSSLYVGGSILPADFRDVLGDALWAMMIVWWAGVAAPRAPLRTRALAALAVCVAVELSQLYHTAALDTVRATVPGQLVLGSDYDPRDLLAYAAGIAVAVVVARTIAE
jgi:hypothetical protein